MNNEANQKTKESAALDSHEANLDSHESDVEADRLFEHMKELMDILPEMQKKGDQLAQARAAREVIRLEHLRQGQENILHDFQNKFDEQAAQEREAKDAGDDAKEKKARYYALMMGNEVSVRRGAEANAQHQVDDALEKGGFTSLDDARAAALEDDAFAELEQEVESYKSDYSSTLAACQQIADDEENA